METEIYLVNYSGDDGTPMAVFSSRETADRFAYERWGFVEPFTIDDYKPIPENTKYYQIRISKDNGGVNEVKEMPFTSWSNDEKNRVVQYRHEFLVVVCAESEKKAVDMALCEASIL